MGITGRGNGSAVVAVITTVLLVTVILLLGPATSHAQIQLMNMWFQFRDAPNILAQELTEQSARRTQQRAAAIAALKSDPTAWRQRQQEVQALYDNLFAPTVPANRTLPKVRHRGNLTRDGFTVQKVRMCT